MPRPILIAALLVACVSSAPRPEPASSMPAAAQATIVSDKTDGDVREAVLSNGLKILLKEDHAAPVATFAVYYKVGSRNEHVGITGSSHLLEHLQFKGTTHFPGREAVWGELSRIGASFNASTWYDRTNYYETVPIEKLPFAIALEADRMRNSTFTDADRQSEMTVVRNELERGENDPNRLLNQELWATSIVSHPYHHPVIGWRSDVENVPTSQLHSYYDVYYQPDNAVVVAVGDFKTDDVLKLVAEKFGVYAGGHTFPPVYTKEEPQRGERRFVINKPGQLGIVALGWHLPPVSSPDIPALKALQLVLSGTLDINEAGDPLDPGISNRLYRSLIEKEIAVSADMEYTLMIDENVGLLSATVRPGVPQQRAEDALRAEIKRLQTEPVSDVELKRAKSRAKASFALSQDGTYGEAMALGYFGLIADWRLARDFSARVSHVTAQDIMRVAKSYFTDRGLTVGWFVPEPPGEGQAAPPTASNRRPGRSWETYRPEAAVQSALAMATEAGGSSSSPDIKANAPTPLASRSAPDIRKKTLANGLRIVVQENHTNPTFSLAGSILAGAVHERRDQLSLAGTTADMLQRGTLHHTKFELAAELEDVGASFGFDEGFEQVSIGALALKDDLDRVLDVMTEELLQPAFPKDELSKSLDDRAASVQQAEDSTHERARRVLMQGLYPKDSPLYIDDAAEVIRQLGTITTDRVRDWYRTYYGPDRTVLTIVGDVDADEVFRKIEARLGSWKPVGGPRVDVPLTPIREKAARVDVPMPDKANVDILMGEQGTIKRVDADYYPAMLANYVLGGGSGLLFKRVRNELGLTYGVGSTLSASKVAGPWSIGLTVNPAVIDKSLAAVHTVVDDWHVHGVTSEDLSRAKTELSGLFVVGLSTNGGLASVLNQYEVLGLGAAYVKEHPKRLQATPLADVNAAILKDFFPDRLLTVVSGTIPSATSGAPKSPP